MTSEEQIIKVFKDNPLIAVVAIPNPDSAVPLANALLEGGIKGIEILILYTGREQ